MGNVMAVHELLSCPYCENVAIYYPGSDLQADAIYCSGCPLGLEEDGMSYQALLAIWNNLPRNTYEAILT